MKTRKNKKGFTIVELVIVIGVIGILSAILIPTFVNLTNKANQAREQEEVRNAYVAYNIDAQDGVLFNEVDDAVTEKVDSVLAIDKVAVKRGNDFFTYSLTNKQWENTGSTTAPTGYTQYGAAEDAKYQYNSCYVYHKAA